MGRHWWKPLPHKGFWLISVPQTFYEWAFQRSITLMGMLWNWPNAFVPIDLL
jgi:hypothetical protein